MKLLLLISGSQAVFGHSQRRVVEGERIIGAIQQVVLCSAALAELVAVKVKGKALVVVVVITSLKGAHNLF